ncbi:hypothetical protein [Cellulosimicrobium marinum]|uniref:hypothetical protein n=1 Tax=Cellulosimicrobium marinum TaxID=1638992 RepID=UPI001E5998D5|nr:hypothetical protein [Cellulosimicrobium marinum]MCB7138158.1 hypothetical protein [Cellulosimicrobium marinum]
MGRAGRTLLAAGAAALVTVAVRRLTDARPPGGDARWTRTNHRGEPISLLEGPSVAAGLVAGALVAGAAPRARAATALAAAGGGAFGLVDDLAEDTSTRTKGLRGHLGALAHGQVTTGGLKVLGIGATSLVAAAVGTRRTGSAFGHLVDVGVNGALIAGTANLVNLLDLRPGRALKASALVSAPFLATSAAATTGAVLGAGGAAAPGDLGERDMLGDCGANALGAVLGSQVALAAPRPVRLLALAGVVGLTLASEKVSFSAVVEGNDVLRRVDSWGRRLGRRPA